MAPRGGNPRIATKGGKVLTESQIKQAGLKVTLPRMKILEILETSGEGQGPRHLRAEDVYRILLSRGEVVGLATVYRVLTQFEAAGLVSRHNFEGGQAFFELYRGAHHDHLVCIKCGQAGGVHGRGHRGAPAGYRGGAWLHPGGPHPEHPRPLPELSGGALRYL